MAEPPPASLARRGPDAPARGAGVDRDGMRPGARLRRALLLALVLAAAAWIAFHLR